MDYNQVKKSLIKEESECFADELNLISVDSEEPFAIREGSDPRGPNGEAASEFFPLTH